MTELDSHANMAVAGKDCTIIRRSGHYANVTPFSSELPTMETVKIGDVGLAYNDPVTLGTYLLVMRNALLIPTMDHNLLPPLLIREASLFLDETPKFQLTSLLRDNHTIYDDETTTIKWYLLLLSDKIAHCGQREQVGEFPVVFLTPDSDQ